MHFINWTIYNVLLNAIEMSKCETVTTKLLQLPEFVYKKVTPKLSFLLARLVKEFIFGECLPLRYSCH